MGSWPSVVLTVRQVRRGKLNRTDWEPLGLQGLLCSDLFIQLFIFLLFIIYLFIYLFRTKGVHALPSSELFTD